MKTIYVTNRGTCSRCKRAGQHCKNMCAACYDYKRRNGHARPREYFAEECLNCKRPLDNIQRRWGRCKPCYEYRRRTGADRPTHLWQRYAPHGWCLCGNPAEAQPVQMAIGGHWRHGQADEYDEPLCSTCREAEREMWR